MPKRYAVRLTAAERSVLADLIAAGAAPARTQAHARILLKADQGAGGPAWTDARIAEALEVSVATAERVRRRWADGGLADALHRRPPRREYRRKLDGAQEAHLVALACSAPPPGRERWTLRLLAHRLVELEVVDGIAPETVRQALKKTSSSRG
jgi:transposase